MADAVIITRTPRLTLSVDPISLGRDRRLALSLDHYYEISETAERPDRWEVRTTGYRYTVRDHEGWELLSYQWHPESRSPITAPHLHLGSRLLQPDLPFSRVHLPTGFITLAAVLQAGITDLGVVPLRKDWNVVLALSEDVLRESFG